MSWGATSSILLWRPTRGAHVAGKFSMADARRVSVFHSAAKEYASVEENPMSPIAARTVVSKKRMASASTNTAAAGAVARRLSMRSVTAAPSRLRMMGLSMFQKCICANLPARNFLATPSGRMAPHCGQDVPLVLTESCKLKIAWSMDSVLAPARSLKNLSLSRPLRKRIPAACFADIAVFPISRWSSGLSFSMEVRNSWKGTSACNWALVSADSSLSSSACLCA